MKKIQSARSESLAGATERNALMLIRTDRSSTMRHPPRARNEPLLTGKLAWHIVLVSGLFLCGVFGTEPMPLLDDLLIVVVGIALFAMIVTEKQLHLRLKAMRAG